MFIILATIRSESSHAGYVQAAFPIRSQCVISEGMPFALRDPGSSAADSVLREVAGCLDEIHASGSVMTFENGVRDSSFIADLVTVAWHNGIPIPIVQSMTEGGPCSPEEAFGMLQLLHNQLKCPIYIRVWKSNESDNGHDPDDDHEVDSVPGYFAECDHETMPVFHTPAALHDAIQSLFESH
ncbi:MAG TPA: hypothetical protein VGE62_02995 [Candidatus Paceibacterota bacterium]